MKRSLMLWRDPAGQRVQRRLGQAIPNRQIRQLLSLFEIAPVTRAVPAKAVLQVRAQAIISRNLRDFAHRPVQWLAMHR